MNDFFRFPHTPHILWLGSGEPRGDKLMTKQEVEELLSGTVIVEEKIDGANTGFSLDEAGEIQVQNRGSYLPKPYSGQFSRLNGWLGQYEYTMKQLLKPDLIAFGEWCAARHSLDYDQLPDFFVLFDIYDKKEQKFWSVRRRNRWAKMAGLQTVPTVAMDHFSTSLLAKLLSENHSRYRQGTPEGIVVRKDTDDWNSGRGKIVQAEFVQAIGDHWSSRGIEWNRVSVEY